MAEASRAAIPTDRTMQFTLRAMLAAIAILAASFSFLAVAFAPLGNALPFLFGASILASLIGTTLAPVFRINRTARRTLMAVGCALAAGLVSSFFVIQFEWRSDHPWPESDVLYVLWAAVRCGLLGGVLGYAISVAFVIVAGNGTHPETARGTAIVPSLGWPRRLVALASSFCRTVHAHFRLQKLLSGGTVITLLVLSWWPYWSFHLQETAAIKLLTAIEDGRIDEIPKRVASVKRFDVPENVIGRVAFRAVNGRNERVRLTALESLKLLGNVVEQSPVLKPTLKQMMRDDSETVRGAAETWLTTIDPTLVRG